MSIPYQLQSVDAWLRAIIKHMRLRKRGHGGEASNALIITIPDNLSEKGVEILLDFVTRQLRKRATPRKRSVTASQIALTIS
jgi:hypothetical protein